MSLVKVRPNGQVTLPSSLRQRAKLNVGDVLEAKLEKGKITLTPASLIDRHIAESLDQIKNGKFYGPFDTADEMIESLHQGSKRSKRPARLADLDSAIRSLDYNLAWRVTSRVRRAPGSEVVPLSQRERLHLIRVMNSARKHSSFR